jgi:hypothetical protein
MKLDYNDLTSSGPAITNIRLHLVIIIMSYNSKLRSLTPSNQTGIDQLKREDTTISLTRIINN